MRYIECDYFSDQFVFKSSVSRKTEPPKFTLDEFFEEKSPVNNVAPVISIVESRIAPQLHPNIDVYKEKLDPEKANYVDLFLMQNGIDSVRRAVVRDFSIGQVKDMADNNNKSEYLKLASGRVFEHFAHLWLAGLINSDEATIMDPVETNKLFRTLNIVIGTNVFPDSVKVHHPKGSVVIEDLFECKMNPSATLDSITKQIKFAKEYFDKFSGRKIFFDRRLTVSKNRNIKAFNIEIGKCPRFYIVIPENRDFEIQTEEDIRLIHAPFSSGFISRLSDAVVKDMLLKIEL